MSITDFHFLPVAGELLVIWFVKPSSLGGQLRHFNGTRWFRVSMPAGTRVDLIESVACPATDGCWAVGSASNGRNAILRLSRGRWSRISSPQPGRGDLEDAWHAVTCVSSADCWAVGNALRGPEIMSWNGYAWHLSHVA